MRGFSVAVGVASATCAIGPLIVLALAGYGVATDPNLNLYGLLFTIPVAAFVALLVGGMASLIPNMAGSVLLGWLGCRHRWARHPLVWLGTGIILGGGIGLLFGGRGAPGASLFLATAGGVCALICRRGSDWDD